MSRIPQQIDKYRILEQVAEGGMGVIYKAEHPTLGRPVILKRLTFAGGDAAAARFRREARIMMGFRHDGIVDVYDHFRSGGSWHIVMEYVEGVSLDRLLREKGPLPSEVALLVALEVARALKYAHDKGVVHRDVKPSNILLSLRGEVKLTDFGVAAARDEEGSTLTTTGITLGTVAYMAPEQIASSRDVDKRADIYSLGAMLYEAVTGKPPFPGSFTPQNLAMIQKGRTRPVRRANPRVSTLVGRIVGRAMRPAPGRRFQDLRELIGLLGRCLRVTESAAVQAALRAYLEGRKAQRVSRRTGVGLSLAFACVFLATAAGAGLLLYRQGALEELLLARQFGALTIAVEGPTVLAPQAALLREGDGAAPIPAALARTAGGWRSRRLYLPAGVYRVAVEADGMLEWRSLYLAPRDLQRRSAATRDGALVAVAASADGLAAAVPLRLQVRVRDRIDGRDVTAATRVEVKIGDGWSPLDEAARTSLAAAGTYEFRFEHDGYYPATQEVRVAAFQRLLRIEAALAPIPAVLRVTTSVAGVRLLVDGSPWYLSAGPQPVYERLRPLDARPQELVLAPGRHRITAELRESAGGAIDLSLEPGERLSVAIESGAGGLVLRRLDRL